MDQKGGRDATDTIGPEHQRGKKSKHKNLHINYNVNSFVLTNLYVSSLHTNDVPHRISRMVEVGVREVR